MVKTKFEDFNLSDEIIHSVKEMGFEEATPIQQQTIPLMLDGLDIIGQSQTGTGKTAAFGIPVLEKLSPRNKKVQAIILCPTRELAVQVSEELRKLSKFINGIKVLPIYGGQPIERQIQALKKGVQIVIGTPGRVMDHMERKTLKLDDIKTVILDEADEMLDMGFIEDIEKILSKIPAERQTALFSATMPQEIIKLAQKFMNSPKLIKIVHKELTVPNIEQYYFEVQEKNKVEVLSRIIDLYSPKLSLVFCNTKRKVDELTTSLQARGYAADGLHGDMKQTQRDRVMSKFRSNSLDILIATDVAARGIDVGSVDAVFNFDVPQDEEYYVHRIGRTARAGRAGKAFTFAVGKDVYKIRDIQKYTKSKIKLQDVPSINDVEESRAEIYLDKIKKIIKENHLTKYTAIIENIIEDDYTSLDIASALLKMVMDENGKAYNDIEEQPDIHIKRKIRRRDDRYTQNNMTKLFINIGRSQKVTVKDILNTFTNQSGLSGRMVGTINILDKFSFIEVPDEYASVVLSSMKNSRINGKKINVEIANKKDSDRD